MGYSVKWVNDHLGITRNMLKYYENEGLLSKNASRKINNYRDYDEADLERIWKIKFLISIGFTAKETKSILNNRNADFYLLLTQKIDETQEKLESSRKLVNFLKTVKLTGRIPSVPEPGSIRFDDFFTYVKENWNFYEELPFDIPAELADVLTEKPVQSYTPDQTEKILELLENSDVLKMPQIYTLHAACKMLSDMRDFAYGSEVIQRMVRSIHEMFVSLNFYPELDGKITPDAFARCVAPMFVDGQISLMHEHNYGKEGCIFIAKAIASYGGYGELDEL